MSPVYSECCSTCGSQKLTPAAPAIRLRPVMWVVAIGVAVLLIPVALNLLQVGLHIAYLWFWRFIFERVLALGILSLVTGWIFGERARKAIGDIWIAGLRLIVSAVEFVIRLLVKTQSGRCEPHRRNGRLEMEDKDD